MATKETRASSLPQTFRFCTLSRVTLQTRGRWRLGNGHQKGERRTGICWEQSVLDKSQLLLQYSSPCFPSIWFGLSDLCAWPNLLQLCWCGHYRIGEPAQGGLRKSRVPQGSLSKLTFILVGRDSSLFSPEKGRNITRNYFSYIKPHCNFHHICARVFHPHKAHLFVEIPLADDRVLHPFLGNFSGYYFENESFTTFSFLFEKI